MKTFRNILIVCLGILTLAACDRHDSLDDRVFVGPMAPMVYWAVQSTTVTAGDSVPFQAQYYTTGESPVSYLEVWYDIIEVEAKEVSAPLLATFSYTVSSTVETQRRIATPSCRIMHNEGWATNFGVNSMGDTTYFKTYYEFNGKFPTSNTLSVIAFGDADWDSAQVVKYFGETFMQDFKDSIEVKMRGRLAREGAYDKVTVNKHWQDFRSACVNMAGMPDTAFSKYIVEELNEIETQRAGTEVYDYYFKDSVLPDVVDSVWGTVQFKDLIYDGNSNHINFRRSYKLNSQLKCFDEAGTAGLSLKAVIELN